MSGPSVLDHLRGQLTRLCGAAGVDPIAPAALLTDLLGSSGSRPASEPPAWPSDVADDHTPVEFSLAYARGEPPAVRVLGEVLGTPPSVRANLAATHQFIDRQAARYHLSTSRLTAVQDLFAPEHPRGVFGMWCSLVFRAGRLPECKVYLNPEIDGVHRSPALVAEALRRLGLDRAHEAMLEHAVRPGELGRGDRLTFFALDLHDRPHTRIKLYLTHHNTHVRDVARAASLVPGVEVADVMDFCRAGAGTDSFSGLPIVDSYTLDAGTGKPIGYSVYVPIRGYVTDDLEARDRVVDLLERHGCDSAAFDEAIDAVSRRSLRAGVGLIAHVSLRLGAPRPGVTVYLSAETYRVNPPAGEPASCSARPDSDLAVPYGTARHSIG